MKESTKLTLKGAIKYISAASMALTITGKEAIVKAIGKKFGVDIPTSGLRGGMIQYMQYRVKEAQHCFAEASEYRRKGE